MLQQFIASTWRTPFSWGENNCALWCASGIAHCTGTDPAADLRGRFHSKFEFRQFLMREGGMLNLVTRRMAEFGELNGDGVAVVQFRGPPLCAFILNGRATARTDSGLLVEDEFKLIRGWSWQ